MKNISKKMLVASLATILIGSSINSVSHAFYEGNIEKSLSQKIGGDKYMQSGFFELLSVEEAYKIAELEDKNRELKRNRISKENHYDEMKAILVNNSIALDFFNEMNVRRKGRGKESNNNEKLTKRTRTDQESSSDTPEIEDIRSDLVSEYKDTYDTNLENVLYRTRYAKLRIILEQIRVLEDTYNDVDESTDILLKKIGVIKKMVQIILDNKDSLNNEDLLDIEDEFTLESIFDL